MTLDYEKLLVKLRKEQAVEAHYDTKQCAVIEQAATAIEALRKELARAGAAGCGLLRRLPMRSL
jgi:DNA-binding transcriptional regulator LsrR (DeoR family)